MSENKHSSQNVVSIFIITVIYIMPTNLRTYRSINKMAATGLRT